jgi:hypothetical protein
MKAVDPLHGVTLETILKELVSQIGWAAMGKAVDIRCFTHDPEHQIQPYLSAPHPLGQSQGRRALSSTESDNL